jgi:hypothetical protein
MSLLILLFGRNTDMLEVVRVSSVEKTDKLNNYLENSFKNARFAEITQAIGMHSLLIDPQHTMKDQSGLYHDMLNLIKQKIRDSKGKSYGSWYSGFSMLMDDLVTSGEVVVNKASLDAIASHRGAYGPFKSVDDFFFWALDDRRLTLGQIVKYVEKTAEVHKN